MRRVKLILTIYCFLFFIFNQGQGNFAFSSEQEDYPDIQFEERIYDFGIAGQQEKVSHNYKFKNIGKGILNIKVVKSSCGCIATLLSSKEVLPGVTGIIKTTFKTGKYEGKQTKSIFVHSNDPDEPELELKITGVVKTEVALKPEFLYFDEVEKGETLTKTLNLIQIGEEQLSLNRVEVANEYFLTRVSSFKDEGHQGFKVDVFLKDNAPVGRFNEVISLHTNLKKHPRIDVPVCGNILGRIRIKPQMLSLGSIKKGASALDKIEVEAIDHRDFKIVKVESNLLFLSTKVIRVKNNEKFEITLRVDENAPAGRVKGEVDIYTDDFDQAVIKVPIYGLITN